MKTKPLTPALSPSDGEREIPVIENPICVFAAQREWILKEFRKAMQEPSKGKRVRRMRELSHRSGQLIREYKRFWDRLLGDDPEGRRRGELILKRMKVQALKRKRKPKHL